MSLSAFSKLPHWFSIATRIVISVGLVTAFYSTLCAAQMFSVPPPNSGMGSGWVGQDETGNHLHVTVSLERDHILLGEPLELRYKIILPGAGETPYGLSVPFDQGSPWLRLSVQDKDGKVVSSTTWSGVHGTWTHDRYAVGGWMEFRLPPYGYYSDRFRVPEEALPIPSEGDYKLIVEAIELRAHKIGHDPHPAPTAPGKPPEIRTIEEPLTAFPMHQTIALPFTTERDETKLSEEVQTLGAIVLKDPLSRTPTGENAVEALYSLSGDAARRTQLELLDQFKGKAPELSWTMQQISNLQTAQAVELLARATWSSDRPANPWILSTMYAAADADVRTLIDAKFAEHHEKRGRPMFIKD